MSTLLFIVGAITLVLGTTTIGYGIPINEFSFGNTLIIAGTTAAVGGLIVIGLGAVVAHLQRVANAMAVRAPIRPNRAVELPEAEPAPSSIPVPVRAEARIRCGRAARVAFRSAAPARGAPGRSIPGRSAAA